MKQLIFFLISIQTFGNIVAQQGIPNGADALLKAYPTTIKSYKDGYLIMANNSNIKYTESKEKNLTQSS